MNVSLTLRILPLLLAISALAEAPGFAREHCEDPFEGQDLRFDPGGWKTDFCRHEVPYTEFRSGGPPRDGIPPIDRPRFVTVDQADGWLEDREPVIALNVGSAWRAYPLQILMWHEVVNDELAGRAVLVTFCPLCYTALAFERPLVSGRRLTFGVSGNLRHSDMVMWDRQTESWWQQFSGRAVVGELTGTRLQQLPSGIVSWRAFRDRHPDGEVLSRDTGHRRAYGRNPYVGYDEVDRQPFMFDGPTNGSHPPMTRLVGVHLGGAPRAFLLDRLRRERAVNDRAGDRDIVVFWAEGVASAVDAATVGKGRDIGETAVFYRDGIRGGLTFTPSGNGRFVDDATKSTWNMNGVATDGPLRGKRLERAPHQDTFWFVWSVFQGR